MAVGRWYLRSTPGTAVHFIRVENRTAGDRNRSCSDRIGVRYQLGEWVRRSWRRRRRGNDLSGARVVPRIEPDMRVEPERRHQLVAEESSGRLAADSADHFADQPSVGDRVIAVLGARRPPRLLLGER